MTFEKHISVAWSVSDTLRALVIVIGAALILVGAVFLLANSLQLTVVQRQAMGIMASILLEASLLATAWFYGPRKHGLKWSALGFHLAPGCWGIPASLALLALGFMANMLYVVFIRLMGWESFLPHPVSPLFGEGLSGFLVAAVPASIVAPIAEETFFRGFVFPGFGSRFGGFWAAAISSTLFALGHLQLGAMIPIFVLGMLLVWLYSSTKSILPCILTHSLYNTIALMVAYFVATIGGK